MIKFSVASQLASVKWKVLWYCNLKNWLTFWLNAPVIVRAKMKEVRTNTAVYSHAQLRTHVIASKTPMWGKSSKHLDWVLDWENHSEWVLSWFSSRLLTGFWQHIHECLPGVRLRHFSTTCAVHIEDCEGWWLSSCRSSVAEHWWLKPSAPSLIPGDCQPFLFLPQKHLISIYTGHWRSKVSLREFHLLTVQGSKSCSQGCCYLEGSSSCSTLN